VAGRPADRDPHAEFTYDAASQLTAAADPAASYDYQYDALGRRTSVTHDIAGLGFPVVLASAYDAAGNRTSLSATIDTTADFVNPTPTTPCTA
jgi:YD repeat-containing protein